MKITSFALCLVAVSLVVVAKAAPGLVGSHFRARMIRDKALLQRRDDPCYDATTAGIAKMSDLNKSLQGYSEVTSLGKVQDFQRAIYAANKKKDDPSYQNIKDAYQIATEALAKATDKGAPESAVSAVRVAAEAMMTAVDNAAFACKS
ncbi:hypothetical protein BKA57DRAFT_452652 [Linnemannia elongata]|nr:hypothetical protein BKA57DRAFT_452652 [Linnemannia elongata]